MLFRRGASGATGAAPASAAQVLTKKAGEKQSARTAERTRAGAAGESRSSRQHSAMIGGGCPLRPLHKGSGLFRFDASSSDGPTHCRCRSLGYADGDIVGGFFKTWNRHRNVTGVVVLRGPEKAPWVQLGDRMMQIVDDWTPPSVLHPEECQREAGHRPFQESWWYCEQDPGCDDVSVVPGSHRALLVPGNQGSADMRSVSEAKAVLSRFPDRSIHLAVISGHGTCTSLRLGRDRLRVGAQGGVPDTATLDFFQALHGKLLSSASVWLDSCSAAEPRACGASNLFQEVASLLPDTTVVAAKTCFVGEPLLRLDDSSGEFAGDPRFEVARRP